MTDLPDINQLIAAVIAEAASAEPLTRLASATRARDELDEITEALLDHFVEEAREAGCSWSQIGSTIGVSKQAAQQRHMTTESVARRLLSRLSLERRSGRRPLRFRRFTPRARSAVVAAQDAARHLGHGFIGTEHLLLGLFAEPDGVAAKILTSMGLTAEAAHASVVDRIGRGPGTAKGHIPFTPRARKALELTLREALSLRHNYIGTEHVLLGILREGNGVGATVLAVHGVTHEATRAQMELILGGTC